MPIDKQLIRSILINRKEIIQQLTFVPRSIAIEDATPTILVGVRRVENPTYFIKRCLNWLRMDTVGMSFYI